MTPDDETRGEGRAIPAQHLIDFAVEVSGWSPCRSKRGVVIFKRDDILSHGYNYKPRGFDCDGSEACKLTCRDEAVHAEQMALLAACGQLRLEGADMLHVKSVSGSMVSSGGPSCVQCSKLALVAGIAGVWLFHEDGWRRYDIADFHRRSLQAQVLPRSS
jgi:deoxycytidylate deaminase